MLCLFVSVAASTASFVRGMINKVLVFGNSFQAPFNGCCETWIYILPRAGFTGKGWSVSFFKQNVERMKLIIQRVLSNYKRKFVFNIYRFKIILVLISISILHN